MWYTPEPPTLTDWPTDSFEFVFPPMNALYSLKNVLGRYGVFSTDE